MFLPVSIRRLTAFGKKIFRTRAGIGNSLCTVFSAEGRTALEILYIDNKIIVCVKPSGVLSTDEPGGVPELLRNALGDEQAPIYTVHRLDAAVSGVMVYARTRHAASDLGKAIQNGNVQKEYLAVACGVLAEKQGELRDLLRRDRTERKTFIADKPGPDTQEARLVYKVRAEKDGLSLVRIRLLTGRTHQIRCQFSARSAPLWGDGKYGGSGEGNIALFSCCLSFPHPLTGERMTFKRKPDDRYPWNIFGLSDEDI